MPFQQVPEVQDGRLIGQGLAQRHPHDALDRQAVVARILHRRVAAVVAELHTVNPPHHRQRIWRPPAPRRGIEGADALLQPLPRHRRVHLLQKLRPPRLALRPVVLRVGQ